VAEQQGRPGDAIALLEPISAVSLNRKSSLGHAYAVAGRTAEARKILADLGKAATESYVPAYWFALERAFEERSTVLAYLLIDPRLEPLRGETRFIVLARRLSGE
jgi:hypothetical protein